MCGPESKPMSSIKDRLHWASLKPPCASSVLLTTDRDRTEFLSFWLSSSHSTQHHRGSKSTVSSTFFPVILCTFLRCQPHGLNAVCACWCLQWYYLADPVSCIVSSMENLLHVIRMEIMLLYGNRVGNVWDVPNKWKFNTEGDPSRWTFSLT